MNVFLPFGAAFEANARCLDWRRLGKQRLEAMQLIKVIEQGGKEPEARRGLGWANSPPALAWLPYPAALKMYYNHILDEWIGRGYNNTMPHYPAEEYELPPWLDDPRIINAYRYNLYLKDPEHYAQFADATPVHGYYWPTKMKSWFHLYDDLGLPTPTSDDPTPPVADRRSQK